MTAALDRYDNFVNVRDPAMVHIWHYRSGLRCMVCQWPVHMHRSSRGNLYMHHGTDKSPAETEQHLAHSAYETYLHERMKYWVCDQLRRHGIDASIEQSIGTQIPDIVATVDSDRRLAIEVQWSPLNPAEANERTAGLLHVGCEVLWLTRHCNWLTQLPALGISDFDVANRDYECFTGLLEVNDEGYLSVQRVAFPLAEFLNHWVVGVFAWGYHDVNKGGWASVADWEQHTKHQTEHIANQNRRIEELQGICEAVQQQLANAELTTSQQAQQVGKYKHALQNEKNATKMWRAKYAEEQHIRRFLAKALLWTLIISSATIFVLIVLLVK